MKTMYKVRIIKKGQKVTYVRFYKESEAKDYVERSNEIFGCQCAFKYVGPCNVKDDASEFKR